MSERDGKYVSTTKILDNGDAKLLWNLAIAGDGYTKDEMTTYHADVERIVETLKDCQPFKRNWSSINIFRIDVHSNESGTDTLAKPAKDGKPAVAAKQVATFFDCGELPRLSRLLGCANPANAMKLFNEKAPNAHARVILVNHKEYGGSGGDVAVASSNGLSGHIMIHEIGHSAFELADEYHYFSECGETGNGLEDERDWAASKANVDRNPNNPKWAALADPKPPIRVVENTGKPCDPLPKGIGVRVGSFEGAGYATKGQYRPSYDCKMRTTLSAFCPVCEKIIEDAIKAHRKQDNTS